MSFLLREVQRPLRPGVTEEDLGKVLVGIGAGLAFVGFVHDLEKCL